MVSKFSVEQRLAILREYDAGGISLIELGAKYAVNEVHIIGMALETFASQREKMHGLRRHGAEEGSNVAGKPALRDLQPCQENGSAPHIRR